MEKLAGRKTQQGLIGVAVRENQAAMVEVRFTLIRAHLKLAAMECALIRKGTTATIYSDH